MQTITEKLMDRRATIATAVGKALMDNKRASLGAAIGLGALVVAGAAYAGYLLVSKMMEERDDMYVIKKPKESKRKAASGRKSTTGTKASRASKKTEPAPTMHKGQDHHFIPNATKGDEHLNPKATSHAPVKHHSKEAAMRHENHKVKAVTGNQKRKVLRIPGK